jgi:hypothetical protein
MYVHVNYGGETRVNAHESGRLHSAKGLKSINNVRNCTEPRKFRVQFLYCLKTNVSLHSLNWFQGIFYSNFLYI